MGLIYGRDQELASLGRLVDRAAEGPAAVVLEGEAGIGKTTLWARGAELAGERSYEVLACRAAQSETRLSFAAIGDLLSGVAEDVLHELPRPQARALRVALVLEEASDEPVEDRSVGLAFLSAIQALAHERPVAVCIDDVQWLDAASRAVIGFAARRLTAERIGLLLSTRSPRDRLLVEIERAAPAGGLERVPVGPLGADVLHRVIVDGLGIAFPPPTLERIRDASGGNPFFALEIARALDRRGSVPPLGQPLPIPTSLEELMRERISALPQGTRDALLVVSALHEATVSLLAAAGVDDGQLDPAVDADVISLDGNRVQFMHPLLSSAVYHGVDEESRRGLHERLASVVTDVEARARHLALSVDTPDPLRASALEQAAHEAQLRGATAAAADLYEEAVRLTPDAAVADLVRLGTAAVDRLSVAGETVRARRLLESLLDRLPEGSPRAQIRQRLGLVVAGVCAFDLALRHLEEALADAGADLSLQAEIERSLAIVCGYRDLRTAIEHARRSLTLAERVGAGDLAEAARRTLLELEVAHGVDTTAPRPTRASALRRARALPIVYGGAPAPWGSPHELHDRSFLDAVILKASDDYDGAATVLETLRDECLRLDRRGSLPAVYFTLAEVEILRGRWAHAGRYARDTRELALQTADPDSPGPHLISGTVEALVAAHEGRVEAARSAATAALAGARRAAHLGFQIRNLAVLGFIEVSLGDYAAARRFLDEGGRLMRAGGYGEPGIFRIAANEIEALVATGEVDQAEKRLGELEQQGQRLNRSWAIATGRRCAALMRHAHGDLRGATRAAESAIEAHEALGSPFERARTLLVQGTLLRQANDKRAARPVLESALAGFSELGAALWSARARAELGRLGGRPSAQGKLTETEDQIVKLVIAGRSNADVARVLFLSPKTVEWNLSKIYKKLRVQSRTELAAKVAKAESRADKPATIGQWPNSTKSR